MRTASRPESAPDLVEERTGEITPVTLGLGVLIGIVMTAANVYLGLYAGMTVSASIPAAVVAMSLFRALRRSNILASNIVQTIASTGESLAAGVIFTVPALVLVGAWTEFRFWPTTLIAICGGLLGVAFMIPLRRALIIEEKELTYPEGVACAAVLRAGSEAHAGGVREIAAGLGLGALFKAASTGLGLFRGTVEWAGRAGDRVIYLGTDISPALIAVGYIVRLEIASLVFIGGAIGWFVGIPLMSGGAEGLALETAGTLWSTRVRYLGVGAMVVGGIWSIFTVRKGILAGIAGLGRMRAGTGHVARTERNMGLRSLATIIVLCSAALFWLYRTFLASAVETVIATVVMIVACFFIVAVASYICGLVGSSNSPVSGMTISALLGTAAILLAAGYRGPDAVLATLGVAAVVCCAACTSGDTSQDLKTGYLIGATPRAQQWAQVLSVIAPAFFIAPVLTLLHATYGIGTGLKAPQATLFASITRGIFGGGDLPWDMIRLGALFGVAVIAADAVLRARGARFRLHLMPLAVGIYLPVSLAVPIFAGGVVRAFVDRSRGRAGSAREADDASDRGVLASSGLIAGEAIMGVLLAIVIYAGVALPLDLLGTVAASIVGLAALALLVGWLYRTGRRSPPDTQVDEGVCVSPR